MRYARIYIGAGASVGTTAGVLALLQVGGVLVGPLGWPDGSQQLIRATRTSESSYAISPALAVQFTRIVQPPPNSPPPERKLTLRLPRWDETSHRRFPPAHRAAVRAVLILQARSAGVLSYLPKEVVVSEVLPLLRYDAWAEQHSPAGEHQAWEKSLDSATRALLAATGGAMDDDEEEEEDDEDEDEEDEDEGGVDSEMGEAEEASSSSSEEEEEEEEEEGDEDGGGEEPPPEPAPPAQPLPPPPRGPAGLADGSSAAAREGEPEGGGEGLGGMQRSGSISSLFRLLAHAGSSRWPADDSVDAPPPQSAAASSRAHAAAQTEHVAIRQRARLW
mmetsp:Transcript_19959/g.59552  ORF Transcript_19959/g.59552 Transcript_19959/m.59552 type:complete len:333 (-) Transcript_19959:486-1484(-)